MKIISQISWNPYPAYPCIFYSSLLQMPVTSVQVSFLWLYRVSVYYATTADTYLVRTPVLGWRKTGASSILGNCKVATPQILGTELWEVARRVVAGSWNIIIDYHVQEVCSKVVTIEEK